MVIVLNPDSPNENHKERGTGSKQEYEGDSASLTDIILLAAVHDCSRFPATCKIFGACFVSWGLAMYGTKAVFFLSCL